MRAGSFTTTMHNTPFGSHATQSHQRSRNRTPPTQTFPLRLVQRERADILQVASYKQSYHSYHLRRSASKIGRRNSRKTTETLNCPPPAWQRATTRRFGHPPKDHKARLVSGHPFINSPGLAPSDYRLFHSLKLHLREKKINKDDDLKTAVKTSSRESPEFWTQGINDLSNKRAKVTDLNGEYIVDSWWF